MDLAETSHFPPEIWEQIFTNLDSDELKDIRLTCRRFRDIVSNCPVLREKFSVILPGVTMDRRYNPLPLPPAARAYFIMSKLVDISAWWPGFGGMLTVLSLRCCKGFPLKMLRFTPNLKVLDSDVGSMDVRGSDAEFDFKLGRLNKLALTFESAEILDIVKRIVPKSLSNLKLDIIEHDGEAQWCFVEFVEMWQGSLKLQLPPVSETLEAIAHLPGLKLTKAKVVPSENCDCDQPFNLPGLVRLVRAQPTLEKLKLWFFPLDGATQLDLYQACSKLKSFHLNAGIFPHIRLQMESFLGKMSHLAYLVLVRVKLPLDAENVSYQLTKLKHLALSYVQVKGKSLLNILKSSAILRAVHFSDCKFDSWAQLLLAISQSKVLQKLTLADINCESIGELNCVPMFESMVSVSLTNINTAGDDLTNIFVRKMAKLTHLLLQCCSSTEKTAEIILQHRFALKFLLIDDDWKLTERAYERIYAELDKQGTELLYSRSFIK